MNMDADLCVPFWPSFVAMNIKMPAHLWVGVHGPFSVLTFGTQHMLDAHGFLFLFLLLSSFIVLFPPLLDQVPFRGVPSVPVFDDFFALLGWEARYLIFDMGDAADHRRVSVASNGS